MREVFSCNSRFNFLSVRGFKLVEIWLSSYALFKRILITFFRRMFVNNDLTSNDTKRYPWANNWGGMLWILVTASKMSLRENSFCARGERSPDRVDTSLLSCRWLDEKVVIRQRIFVSLGDRGRGLVEWIVVWCSRTWNPLLIHYVYW